MRRLGPIVMTITLIGALAVGAASAQPADHVVLISVDGLRPDFYLDREFPAPMMQQMVVEGAHAERVRSVFPSVTYPAHTSIITGVLPARHGIYYNSPFEPDGQTGRWYWEEEEIRVPTLWDAIREAGLTTASIGWPVSVGAPIDHNLPETWPLDRDRDPVDHLREASSPNGLWEELEREATGRLTAGNFTIDHMTRDDRAGEIAAYLLAHHRPALLTVHLLETDHFQHEEGRNGNLVRRSVATADRAIARIVEAAERAGILSRTAFMVTGDHGHMDIHTQLAPNVWLARAGLLEAVPGRGRWRAAFHTTGASAFLHLKRSDDSAAVEEVLTILDSLPAGIRKLFRVLSPEDLARLGSAPEAALALAPAPGIHFSSSAEMPVISAVDGATHGYLPDVEQMLTGFVGWGAGFRRGAVAAEMDLVDIAPLAARLLGVPFEPADGTPPMGLLLEAEADEEEH